MLRLDPQPPALDQIEERLLVSGELEEPVALDDCLRCFAVLRTAPAVQIVRTHERLTAGAVETLVVTLVKITRLSAGPPQPLDAGEMTGR